MSRVDAAQGRYRALWQVPGAPVLLVAGVVARIGQGVTVFTWLLLVEATTGSYADAGLVTACTSVATAAAAPVGGRLGDRFGPARALPWYAALYAASQMVLLAAVLVRGPLALLCMMALVSGAAFPATSPALRAAWLRLTDEGSGRERLRTPAMAAESVLFEVVFVVGPLLLALVMFGAGPLGTWLGTDPSVAGPTAALALSAVTTFTGTVWMCRGSGMRAVQPATLEHRTRGLGPLRVRGFLALVACAVGVAFSFGSTPVSIAALASERSGSPEQTTAVLIAVWSIGSAAGGLWFGARSFATPLPRQLVLLLVLLAVGYCVWALAPGVLVFGAVLTFTGVVIAPTMTVMAALVAKAVPPTMTTEAFTWLTTTNLTAAALGSATAGVLVDRPGGITVSILVAAAAAGAAAAVAVVSPLDRAAQPPPVPVLTSSTPT